MQVARIVGLSGVIAMLACGGDSTPTDSGDGNGSTTDVAIQDFSFSPATVTIKAGTTVRWVNHGPSQHTTTSDDNVWDSGSLNPPSGGNGYSGGSAGGSFRLTFNQSGTYTYHCSLHPPANYPGFRGTVVVNP